MSYLRIVAYQLVAPIIIVIGFLGNSLNLYVLTKLPINPHTKSYLTTLTITDLCVLVFEIPMVIRLHDLLAVSSPIAFFYAHFELPLLNASIATSIFIVVCLTIERYRSVCLRNMFATTQTRKKAVGYLTGCLVFGVIISIPLAMLKNVCQLNDNNYNSWSVQENTQTSRMGIWYVYLAVSEGFVRIIPGIIIAVLNILIIRKFQVLQKQRANLIRICRPTCYFKTKRLYEEKRLVILLQANVILFFVTMVPAACLSFLYQNYGEKEFQFQVFRAVANILELCNSAFNFGFYILRSSEIRGRVKETLIELYKCGDKESTKDCDRDVSGSACRIPDGIYRTTITSL